MPARLAPFARVALAILGLIAFTASGLRADAVGYGGRHEHRAESARYEAVHVHDWDWRKSDALFSRPDALDAFFTAANDFSRVTVRERATGKAILDTPAPALTRLWISPDETLLVGLSNVMLRNPVQLAIWRLPSGTLVWREHITPQQAELGAEAMADHLLAHPENAALLASLSRKQGPRYVVDFLQMDMSKRLGKAAWTDLFRHVAPHPYSVNFESTVTNHVYWYREPDPALRIDPDPDADTVQLSLLDPRGIRFRIVLPTETPATPSPSPATPHPWQDIRLTDPRTLRPDDVFLHRIQELNTPAFVVLPPDALGAGPAGHLHETLHSRLQMAEPYALFVPDAAEAAAARTATLYLYQIVPDLRRAPDRRSGEIAQLVGVEIAGRRGVLVNVIPRVASRPETEFWLWHDGGPRIFQLFFDLEDGAITHWRFNGGF
ncbi:MAG: hypothetical protein H7067_09385 [Burkholderiales bacterium]|nr:hypothetical protein [Opitutaceae bacterium]